MPGFDITQYDHVSVLITDLKRTRAFYGQFLGLKEIAKPRTFDFKVLWYELGNQTLHLLQKPQPDTTSARHFALRVADVDQARRYCQQHQVPTLETTKIPGADRFFIFDPDGNRIEVIQWHEPYDPAIRGAKEFDR